jgi:hypothetical protein
MRRGLRCLAAIGLSAAGLAAFGPGAALAGTVDQQQPVAEVANPFSGTNSRAQTFTAGISGKIDQVDLTLSTVTTTLPLKVEVRNVEGGAPGNAVLGTQTDVNPINGPTENQVVPVKFLGLQADVVKGTQYAIVVYTGDIGWAWNGTLTPGPYTGGTALHSSSGVGNGPWTADDWDMAFKTYVAPSSSTGPTGQRAAALKKCKKKHSKKKRKKCRKKARKLPV